MRKRGFTIIELTIVIALILLLSALITLSLFKSRQKAKLSRVSTELSDISTSLAQYAEDNGYQYPADVSRAVPPGLEKYLQGGVWPKSVWPHGVFDWDNWVVNGVQTYQISYRLCDINDPIAWCSDPVLFPNFTRNSSIFYCISGNCVPHIDHQTDPGYCVNCADKTVNY